MILIDLLGLLTFILFLNNYNLLISDINYLSSLFKLAYFLISHININFINIYEYLVIFYLSKLTVQFKKFDFAISNLISNH